MAPRCPTEFKAPRFESIFLLLCPTKRREAPLFWVKAAFVEAAPGYTYRRNALGALGLRRACVPASNTGDLGPVNTNRAAATGADFFECEERGETNAGRILATSDEAIGKICPVPPGCGQNETTLRCHPRLWARHSLRIPPRLVSFCRATLAVLLVLTGPRTASWESEENDGWGRIVH